jgi:transcriptional regulator with XRE-family HTH domain
MAPTEFGAWLRYEREARDWTLAEMAEVLGVHRNTVARWERGDFEPSALTQRAVRDTLAKHRWK